MLGLDATLWRNLDDLSIQDVRRTVQDDETPFVPVSYGAIGEGQQWQHFAPAIRQSEFEGRLNSLYRRVEKACGLSQGILTERQQMNYANRDEVRAAMYDTYSLVSLMRREIETLCATCSTPPTCWPSASGLLLPAPVDSGKRPLTGT